jgi:hypothetical protein
MGPVARARLAASHVPPARARIELLCPSEASTHRKLRLRRRHNPESFVGRRRGCNSVIARPKQKTKRNTSDWAL